MTGKVVDAKFESYFANLVEPYRPPSRGGNTKAHHQHAIIIGGERYSFLALGSRKWAYITDTVSFDWEWDGSKKHRNIKPETFVAKDKGGNVMIRGHRDTKKWRTASTRMPGSRREQRD